MILILGASGFIGSYMIRKLLDEKKQVVGTYFSKKPDFEHKNLTWIQLDIGKKEDFSKLPTSNVEAIIMFAGRLPANVKYDDANFDDSEEYVKTNVLGTIYALEYCVKNKIPNFLYTSSYSDILANGIDGKPIKENAERKIKYTGDHSAYIISKLAAIDYIFHYAKTFDFKPIIFRLPPVYGVGPHGTIYVDGKAYKSGIQTFVEKAQNGEDIELWGNENLYRDIIYVKDLVDACYQAIESKDAYGIYNISNGEKLYLKDQIQTIIDVFGKDKKSKIVLRPEKPNNSPSYVLDISKSIKDFGFAPKFADYKDMMIDFKKEMENNFYNDWFKDRKNK